MRIPPRRIMVVMIVTILAVAGALAAVDFGSLQGSLNGSSTSATKVVFSLGQTPRILGPGTTMNYTLTLTPGSGAAGNATLSSQGSDQLRVRFEPSRVSLGGGEAAADVTVTAGTVIPPGNYKVTIIVAGAGWKTNVTYDFQVVLHLIQLLGGGSGPGPFNPENASVGIGETVTWISLDPGADEYSGIRSVKMVELNQSSGALGLYDTWSFAFDRAGTYHIEDYLNGGLVADAVVVVA